MGGKSVGASAAGSLNSSICNSVATTTTAATANNSLSQQQQQLQAKYIKSKRHQSRYSNLQHSGHDSSSYLHLNSLWSIWYGVLLTLFQGYLAMHGAYRFLGCSLIPWKIEPVAELNLQIVLSGVVFILLPVFFTSAVFKVGNLANDGIKLATGARERRCTLAPQDGLEEESRGGTLRALWTHGGPTAAFVHILIALCLLLPRLLLEARIIENGLLPKEQVWATELDFVVINRRNLMALSVVDSMPPSATQRKQQDEQRLLNMTTNSLEREDEGEDYYNDTMFTPMRGAGAAAGMGAINNNLFELMRDKQGSNGRKAAKTTATTTSQPSYFQVPDLINREDAVEQKGEELLERESVGEEGAIILPDFDQQETTTRDSNIHRVRTEMLPELIIPSTPVSSNSKIIAIKPKTQKRRIYKRSTDLKSSVEIEPEYMLGDAAISSSEFVARSSSEQLEESSEQDDADFQSLPALTPLTTPSATPNSNDYVRLDGFAGMLQLFFGIDKPIDVAIFAQPPSAEFVNLLCALLVWTVRYPAVFWNTSKSFACVFSLQMIVAALDTVLGYVGVSNLYKLQVYAEAMPVHQPGLVLNATVTLALYLLSTALVLASSMVLYLYGHGRLATRMRDRSVITLKANETWIYFAHCASLCFVLALAVVKAPLLNDLSATYKNNLHCPTFLAALVGVTHLLLWIVVWLCLTIKRRWQFKLPPLDHTYGGLLNKASAQPLLMSSGQRTGSNSSSGGNSTSTTVNGMDGGKPDMMSTATSTELAGMSLAAQEDIYWPKLTPSSPKLKVTFNEVTSTSDDVLLIGDQEQTDGKRHTGRGAALCFAGAAGEIDDGEYATLRAATAGAVVGITMGSMKSNNISVGVTVGVGVSGGLLHLSEYDEMLPPPPANHQQHHNKQGHAHAHAHAHDYANLSGMGGISDDNISEEGKLLACVRDDSITYASTRDLEPPQPAPPPPPPLPVKGAALPPPPAVQHPHAPFARAPQAMPEIMQLSPEHHKPPPQQPSVHQQQQQPLAHPLQPHYQHLVSPLAPVTVAVHTNEAHIASSSTPRCLRRADSGVPNEALTPRSDTNSITESSHTTSPPERAPSESSSGVHSGEERELDVVIRPRANSKAPPRPPQPPIQEEPYGRCTNMRMSSFNADPANAINSATLPLQRSVPEQKFDYTAHCSTMPLPAGCHSQQLVNGNNNGGYASTSAMSSSMGPPPPPSQVSSFKTPSMHYANSAVALGAQPHTTLPNGVRYSNPHFLRRLPHVSKAAESPYGHLGYGAAHHAFSKLPHETHPTIPEDRDSANYSMASDQDCGLYVTAQLH
ncbi:tinc [Drosophila busckii]|uniref:Tinc n=1 Tax=Drosophila busckii TaxID=30019 RepID=A0A0M4EU24_DROBS|nr:tinc [Drosophila busckii]